MPPGLEPAGDISIEQSEEEAVAEDEAAFESTTQTFVEVPND